MSTNRRISSAAMILGLGLVASAAPSCGGESSLGDENGTGGSGTAGTGGSYFDGGGGDGAIVGTGGGAADANFEGCVSTGQVAENRMQPADIIFAVDNSPSMRDEIEWTRDNLNAFSQTIADQGIDNRIVMISCLHDECDGHKNTWGICVAPPLGAAGGCPDNDTNPPSYLHIDLRIPSMKGLNRIIETYEDWKGILRPTSVTHFVAISDDGEEWTAQAFQDSLAALDPPVTNYVFHGIFSSMGKEDACAISNSEPCCEFAAPSGEGVSYRELVNATGGVAGDLCEQDFDPVFQQFATSVIEHSQLDCAWTIPAPPEGETLAPNMVNVVFIDGNGERTPFGRVDGVADCANVENGWYYDNSISPTEVLVCPQTCTWIQGQAGAQIDIQFGCATEIAAPK